MSRSLEILLGQTDCSQKLSNARFFRPVNRTQPTRESKINASSRDVQMNRLWLWAITAAASLNISALFLSFNGLTLYPTSTSPAAKPYRHWSNDHNVVHVIQTRFQQHQPDLVHLGRARLALFKTFCLRTVSQQTSGQFLWIIRAGKCQ
jgi:hypothetical protein